MAAFPQGSRGSEFGDLISQKIASEGETFYHHYDGLGSTAVLTDSDGVVTDEYDFEAFGETATESGPTPNPYKWVARVGYRYDEETGLYDIRRRKYAPGQGRFLSEDPVRDQEENLYRYVANDPLKYVDPSGLAITDPSGRGSYRARCECLKAEYRGFQPTNPYASHWIEHKVSVETVCTSSDLIDDCCKIICKQKGFRYSGSAEPLPPSSDHPFCTQYNPEQASQRGFWEDCWVDDFVYGMVVIGAWENVICGTGQQLQETYLQADDCYQWYQYQQECLRTGDFSRPLPEARSQALCALESGQISSGEYYLNLGKNVFTFGNYSHWEAFQAYQRGEIDETELSRRIGPTAVFQIVGGKAIMRQGGGFLNEPIQKLPGTLCRTAKQPFIRIRQGVESLVLEPPEAVPIPNEFMLSCLRPPQCNSPPPPCTPPVIPTPGGLPTIVMPPHSSPTGGLCWRCVTPAPRTFPQHATDTLATIRRTNAPPAGYRGGGIFENDGRRGGQVLPRTTSNGTPITYREFDVHPHTPGVNRGAERIVVGSDRRAYYTCDHYATFTEMQ